MRYGMTKRQHDLLNYLDKYIAEHGYSPSFDEMKAALGLASKSGVHRIVTALEERGLISRLPDRARSIQVNAEAAQFTGFAA